MKREGTSVVSVRSQGIQLESIHTKVLKGGLQPWLLHLKQPDLPWEVRWLLLGKKVFTGNDPDTEFKGRMFDKATVWSWN